jgi:hypothetical protein
LGIGRSFSLFTIASNSLGVSVILFSFSISVVLLVMPILYTIG